MSYCLIPRYSYRLPFTNHPTCFRQEIDWPEHGPHDGGGEGVPEPGGGAALPRVSGGGDEPRADQVRPPVLPPLRPHLGGGARHPRQGGLPRLPGARRHQAEPPGAAGHGAHRRHRQVRPAPVEGACL